MIFTKRFAPVESDSLTEVEVGDETLQIVCGAPNVDQGQKVVVAKVGAVMPSGMVIKDAEQIGRAHV